MARRETAASRDHRISGPKRSEFGESHLETGSVLSECETRGISIRYGAQRFDPHQTRRRYTLHAQVHC